MGFINSKQVYFSCTYAEIYTDCFQLHAPVLHRLYSDILALITARDPTLWVNFQNSVFAAYTFNFGPQVITNPHVDFRNLSWGWCAVTALGDFDHTQGGHLVLWDLCMVIEFPRGSTIFIPSALITHSNLPIQPGECRMSFTQYTASGMFHWVAHGYRTKEAADEAGVEPADWWNAGTHMFSNLVESD